MLVQNLYQLFPDQPYLLMMYKAIFLMAYYSLFWIGEISFSNHVIKAKDVHIGHNKKKMMFILHSAHSQNTKPQIVK